MNLEIPVISEFTIFTAALMSSINSLLFFLIGMSYFIAWQKTGYRSILGQAIFFLGLTPGAIISAYTSWSFFADPTTLKLVPGAELRSVLTFLVTMVLFYTLWISPSKRDLHKRDAEVVKETIHKN